MKGYIYQITNILNGKAYVGLTTQTIESRIHQHWRDGRSRVNHSRQPLHKAIHKYGRDAFEIDVLEEVEAPTKVELMTKLCEREIFYIEQLHTYDKGYNATIGGGGTVGKGMKKEQRELISNINSKSIVRYDLKGVIVGEYKSGTIAAEQLGCSRSPICKCALGKVPIVDYHIWKYKGEELTKEELKQRIDKAPRIIHKCTLSGDFVAEYTSAREAGISVGVSRSTIERAIEKNVECRNFLFFSKTVDESKIHC